MPAWENYLLLINYSAWPHHNKPKRRTVLVASHVHKNYSIFVEDRKQIVKIKMDELALKSVVIHDPKIIEELCRLGGELEKIENLEK